MKTATTTQLDITKTVTVELRQKDFVEFLRQQGAEVKNPDDIKVYVRVPGGGDYSNTDLELDESSVYVEWTTVTTETNTK